MVPLLKELLPPPPRWAGGRGPNYLLTGGPLRPTRSRPCWWTRGPLLRTYGVEVREAAQVETPVRNRGRRSELVGELVLREDHQRFAGLHDGERAVLRCEDELPIRDDR